MTLIDREFSNGNTTNLPGFTDDQPGWKNKIKSLILLFFILGMGLSLNACQPQRGDEIAGKRATAGGTASTGESSLKPAQIPDLTVEDIEGNIVSLRALKGKVVFINFWATWCPPCREEMPTIQKLKTHFNGNKDIVFLMVDIDGRLKASSNYLKKHGYDLPVYKAQGAIPRAFLGDAIPVTLILDKAGTVVARVEGASDYGTEEVYKGIEELLNK